MQLRLFAAIFLAASHVSVAAGTASVDIKVFQFQPKLIAVKSGDTVTWTNSDAIEHSVTSGSLGKPTDAFDSGLFTKGHQFSHTFNSVGSFTYFCKRHPNMRATVEVRP